MKWNIGMLVFMFGFELLKPTQGNGWKAFLMCVFLLNVGSLLLHIYYPDKEP